MPNKKKNVNNRNNSENKLKQTMSWMIIIKKKNGRKKELP